MKKFFLPVFLIALPALLFAGDENFAKRKKKKTAFTQGQLTFQGGVGLPSMVKPDTDTLRYFGTVEVSSQPVYILRGEYGVTGNIGIGLFMGLTFSEATYTDNTDPDNINGFKYTSFLIGARPAFHPTTKSPKFDPFVAGIIGFNAMSEKPFGNDNPLETEHKKLIWGIHAGANFYFIEKLAAFAEVGYGMSVANAGIVLKL